MEKQQDRRTYTADEKDLARRRKGLRLYTYLACRKDDPSDMYGVVFYTKKGWSSTKLVAIKGQCVFRTARPAKAAGYSKADAQDVWNECVRVVNRIKARGRDKEKIRYISSRPNLPRKPGSCYEAVSTKVVKPYDRIYVGCRRADGGITARRMPIEDFRFFVTRIWSKSCPIEFSPEDNRTLRIVAAGRAQKTDKLCLNFSPKKDFDFNFKWSVGRDTGVRLARRDHEPGPVLSGTQADGHKPVNPVARAVNVLRDPGVQNSGTDEMRKGESPKRSGGEGDARAPDSNSESAALSHVLASGTRADRTPPI